jgi:predicted DNA-binding antitoxin AbrB/MazE fold protein
MASNTITVEAVFEDGVLRPLEPLSLPARQRVTLIVQVPNGAREWPDDVAAIYQEIAADDRRLAGALLSTVQRTWPAGEEQP